MSYRSRHRLYGWRKAKRAWLKLPKDPLWGDRLRTFTGLPEYQTLMQAVIEDTMARWDAMIQDPPSPWMRSMRS